jgi:hypothetical protein
MEAIGLDRGTRNHDGAGDFSKWYVAASRRRSVGRELHWVEQSRVSGESGGRRNQVQGTRVVNSRGVQRK